MKRKIIEVYVEEKNEEDQISFEFEKCEDTDIANSTMKMLLFAFTKYKRNEDEIEAEFE